MELKVCLLLLLLHQVTDACHVFERKVDEVRKKRQVDDIDSPLESIILRRYFTSCMTNAAGEAYKWETLVDVNVLDSFWYERNDKSSCSVRTGSDTPECWISRLPLFLKGVANLIEDATHCINQFAFDRSEGKDDFSGFRLRDENKKRRKKRQIADEDGFSLMSPEVQEYIACSESEVQLQPGRTDLNFPALVNFIQRYTVCNPELAGCGENGTEILSGGADVPRWPYRFQALIKQSSPLSSSIATCNARIFPLNPTTPVSTTTQATTSTATTQATTSTVTTQTTTSTTTTQTTPASTTTQTTISTTTTQTTTSTTMTTQEPCARLDLAIVMDSSSSIESVHFETEREVVRELISRIPVGLDRIKVTCVRFNRHPSYLWKFSNSTNSSALIPHIDDLVYEGNGTNIMRALWKMRKESFVPSNGDRENAPNMVILLTDGRTKDDLEYRAPRFRRATNSTLVVVPIHKYVLDNIRLLASPPSEEHIFYPDDLEDLLSLISEVAACEE